MGLAVVLHLVDLSKACLSRKLPRHRHRDGAATWPRARAPSLPLCATCSRSRGHVFASPCRLCTSAFALARPRFRVFASPCRLSASLHLCVSASHVRVATCSRHCGVSASLRHCVSASHVGHAALPARGVQDARDRASPQPRLGRGWRWLGHEREARQRRGHVTVHEQRVDACSHQKER